MTPPVEVDGVAVLVVLVVLVNAVWNTAVGSTGGVTFATLAATLGPAVAIPVQSVVEGTSAGYRIWYLRDQIDFDFVGAFAVGGLIGSVLGFPAVRWTLQQGNDDVLTIVVAVFIIAMTWVPFARSLARTRVGPAMAGTVTTFLSLFVGGMGAPIAAAVESRGADHPVVIATSTTAIYLQYLVRLLLFGITGAILREHLWLVTAMIGASLFGTWIGAKALLRVDPDVGRKLFRGVVTVIAASMILRVLR